MRLRTRLIMVVMAVVLLSGLVLTAFIQTRIAHLLRQSLNSELTYLARFIAFDAVEPFLTENWPGLQLLLNEHKGVEPGVEYVYISDGRDKVYTHTFREGFPVELKRANPVLPGQAPGTQRLLVDGKAIIDVGFPLPGRIPAVVHLGHSEEELAGQVGDMSRGVIGILALVLLGMATAAAVFSRRVTRPLADIGVAAEAIAAGDFTRRVKVTSGDEVGELAGIVNLMTEKLAATVSELADARSRLRQIIEQMPFPVTVFDVSGRCTMVNRAFCGAFNAEEKAFVETYNILQDPAAEKQGIAAKVREALAGRLVVMPELELRADQWREHPSGATVESPRWFSETIFPVFRPSGEVWRVVTIAEDITERYASEQALREANAGLARQNEELKSLDRLKDALVRDVTHELKTPVAKQAMQLEILRSFLRDRDLLAEVEPLLAVMDGAIRRQRADINNILNLARLESGDWHFRKNSFALDEFLRETVDEYLPLIREAGIRLDLELAPMTISSDREMLWHVFSNLLSNAVKFTAAAAHPRIGVGLGTKNGQVVVTVEDNGIGISVENLPHIFDQFFKANPSAEGSGLGLGIVRRLLEGLGGNVEVSSAGVGKGTTIRVFLPAGTSS